MEAFGPRTMLVAAALHALLSTRKEGFSWSPDEVAEEAITVADACLDRMGLNRRDGLPLLRSLCKRDDHHDGPCNGLPRESCPGYEEE
jgi:hypothetical protein